MDEGQVGCSPAFCRGSVWDLSLHIQWSHMFLLIEDQGGQGYELFFKTRELKKKWMEQFEMAMWVSFSCCFVRSPHHKISSNNELKTKHSKDKNETPRIAAATNEKRKDKIKNQGLIVFLLCLFLHSLLFLLPSSGSSSKYTLHSHFPVCFSLFISFSSSASSSTCFSFYWGESYITNPKHLIANSVALKHLWNL